MERASSRIPHNLIDTNQASRSGGPILNQQDALAANTVRVDCAVKREGDPRLETETVQCVDDRDVVAIRRLLEAIRLRHSNSPASYLAILLDGELIAREGTDCRIHKIENSMNIACGGHAEEAGYDQRCRDKRTFHVESRSRRQRILKSVHIEVLAPHGESPPCRVRLA